MAKTSAKVKEAKREQVAAIRANRTEEEVARDREAARLRMDKIRKSRTVDEWNQAQAAEKERRRWQPNWRSREREKWGDAATAERKRKLASGKWKLAENNWDLEAIDPDNLQWDCPAGSKCLCHYPRRCPKCTRSFFGCLAPCPSAICRERQQAATEKSKNQQDEQ